MGRKSVFEIGEARADAGFGGAVPFFNVYIRRLLADMMLQSEVHLSEGYEA